MQRSRLAVERMTDVQLWLALRNRLYWIEPGQIKGSSYLERRTAWGEAIAVVRELEMRGTQLQLPLGKGEEVAGGSHVGGTVG